MKCNHCGCYFEGKFCPECGAKADFRTPQPMYQSTPSAYQTEVKPKKKKKPVVIILLIIVAVIGAMAFFGNQVEKEPSQSAQSTENTTKGNAVDTTVDADSTNKPVSNEVLTTKVSETTESTTKPTTTEKENDLANGMRPEFKAAMDSYETFMTDYVDFMKKFKQNPSDLTILADYADYMNKYTDFVESFEQWDNEEMNTAETAYYIDVQARVSKKLLEVAE